MTHRSPRYRTLAELSTCASCLCLGLAFACGETTKNNAHDETTTGSTTATGPTNGGSVTGGPTTSGTTTGGGGTTGSDCPSLEPAAGSACPMDNRVCAYDNCAAPDYRDYHELNCVNGAWVLAFTEACPVGQCPADTPFVGSYCNAGVTPGPCSAVDACGEVREATCFDWTWQTLDNKLPELPGTSAGGADGAGMDPVVPQCPVNPPYSGDRCCPGAVPERCDYTEGDPDGAAGASFLINPVTSTGGDGDAPYVLQCAVCTDQMYWSSCPQE
jgi:hypothetical protein